MLKAFPEPIQPSSFGLLPFDADLVRRILLGRDCLGDEAYQHHVHYAIRKGWLNPRGELTGRGRELVNLVADEDRWQGAWARARETFGQWPDWNCVVWVYREGKGMKGEG